MKEEIFSLAMLTLLLIFAASSHGQGVPEISYPTPQTYTVGTAIVPLIPSSKNGTTPATLYSLVRTFAGNTTSGNKNGNGTSASFFWPSGIAVDSAGTVYVADVLNNMIRKITVTGMVSTLAGSTVPGCKNGRDTTARFYYPSGVAVDNTGNVYVADYANNMIRKITKSGEVSILAGNTAPGHVDGRDTTARFYRPYGIAVDKAGNVYVADQYNHLIRKITANGEVTTLAGSTTPGFVDGKGSLAKFYWPSGIAADRFGNVYVSDQFNHLIRKITGTGVVSTLAGSIKSGYMDGTNAKARFNFPSGIAVDSSGTVYVTDQFNHLIRKITTIGLVSTLTGRTGYGDAISTRTPNSFFRPSGIAVDASGNLYITENHNNTIRKIIQTRFSIHPQLPEGLKFDITSGIISGKPKGTSPATIYTVTATNAQGSSSTTICIRVDVHPKLNFEVQSNADHQMVITFTSGNQNPVRITVYTIHGKKMLSTTSSDNMILLNHDFQPGAYIVSATGENGHISKKIILH